MAEQRILEQIGLTDLQLRRYLRKMIQFYRTLTPKEREVFNTCSEDQVKEAAKAFSGKITAKELEEFIKSKEPKGASMLVIVRKRCDEDEDELQENK